MQDTLAHRGPDETATRFVAATDDHPEVALGHCRLAIIDLDGGQQPMADTGSGSWLVYNGEIYNYRALRAELRAEGCTFDDDSDTQVLLQAYLTWGPVCVTRLRGMFAFALWDGARQQLFMARDPYGKKPLFYTCSDDALVFASEIKALLEFPGVAAHMDQRALAHYFIYRYVPGPATLYADIAKLPPGSRALWRDGELDVERYYQPPDSRARPTGSVPADPVAQFSRHLDEAVAARMISDVPFGAFLSGGLDSSAIVALMGRHSIRAVQTFSVGFAEAAYSELAHARQVAQHIGADHHELVIRAEDLMDRLPALVRYRDAPIAETADIPIYMLAREAAQTVKMVLTGEGSDELLAGYPKHAFERFVAPYQAIPGPLRRGVIVPLINALPYRFRRAKAAIANLERGDPGERFPGWFGALDIHQRDRLLAARCSSAGSPGLATRVENSPLRRILHFDQTSWLPDNLLERGDRMTMAASIEARMPFLDTDLAAYVSSLPDRFRLRGMQGKWLLRQAMRALLPAAILDRPKVGFRLPVNEWFAGPMRDYLYDHLTGGDSQTRALYQRAELERVLAEHVRGRQNHEKLLWAMLNLELWHRHCLTGAAQCKSASGC